MEVIAFVIGTWVLCGLWAMSLVVAGGKEDAARRRATSDLAAQRFYIEAS
jgi:hypothetical protein